MRAVTDMNPYGQPSLGVRTERWCRQFCVVLARALLKPRPWTPCTGGTDVTSLVIASRSHCPRPTTRTKPFGKSRCHRYAIPCPAVHCRFRCLPGATTQQTSV